MLQGFDPTEQRDFIEAMLHPGPTQSQCDNPQARESILLATNDPTSCIATVNGPGFCPIFSNADVDVMAGLSDDQIWAAINSSEMNPAMENWPRDRIAMTRTILELNHQGDLAASLPCDPPTVTVIDADQIAPIEDLEAQVEVLAGRTESLFVTKCISCHGPRDHFRVGRELPLTDLRELSRRTQAYQQIESGAMPSGGGLSEQEKTEMLRLLREAAATSSTGN